MRVCSGQFTLLVLKPGFVRQLTIIYATDVRTYDKGHIFRGERRVISRKEEEEIVRYSVFF